MECLLSESQLAGSMGVTWSTESGNPLPQGRYNTTCPLNRTLILRNLMSPEDINTYICSIGQPLRFFFLALFSES